MSNSDITPEELFAVMLAGGRLSDQRSAALPEHKYYDPAQSFKFAAEIERDRMKKIQKNAEQIDSAK